MRIFKNGISLKWLLLFLGIVVGIGYAIASVNPIISNTNSYFDVVWANYFRGDISNVTGVLPNPSIPASAANQSGMNVFTSQTGITLQNDGNAIAYKDSSGTIRFLTGLRSDISPSLDFVFYSYGGNWNFTGGKITVTGVSSNTGESACWVATTKELVRNAGVSNTCAPSAEKYKDIRGKFNDSTVFNKFSQLDPIVFSYKSDGKHLERFGFSANRVAVLYPQLATTHYEGNGAFLKLILNQSDPTKADSVEYTDGVIMPIEGIDYEMFSAILVNQIHDQQFQIDIQAAQLRNICTNQLALCS